MLYQAFQAHTDFYWPLRTQVTSARGLLERLAPPAHLASRCASGGWRRPTRWPRSSS